MLEEKQLHLAGQTLALVLLALSIFLVLPPARAAAQIQLSNPSPGTGEFGSSVAVSGQTVVVGARYENASGFLEPGSAYIFDGQTGSLVATLATSDPTYLGFFGSTVAVSGNTVVVGAPFESSPVGNVTVIVGHAYVFNAQTGSLIAMLTSPNAQGYRSYGEVLAFGYSVAVSGNTVVVGAPFENSSSGAIYRAGNAYVFNAQTGSLITELTTPNPQFLGEFGTSVAVSGSTVVVGAPGENSSSGAIISAGNAYVFNATTGSLLETLASPDAQRLGHFGDSVTISGSTVVVGAPSEPEESEGAGNAYIFNAQTGSLITMLTSPNPQPGYFGGYDFGCSVAVSGNAVVVGAFGEYFLAENSTFPVLGAGDAYIFNAQTGSLITMLTSPNPTTGGAFGGTAAVSGSTVVIGALAESGQAGNSYVFTVTGSSTATVSSATLASSSSASYSTTTTSPSSSYVTTSSSSSSGLSSSSGGVPEFPFNVGLMTLMAAVIAATYVLTRVKASKTPGKKPI